MMLQITIYPCSKWFKKVVLVAFWIGLGSGLYPTTAYGKSRPPQGSSHIEALVGRVLPTYKASFIFEKISAQNDVFELESKGSKLVIRGNNDNTMAVGLNYYLKNYCYVYVSWVKTELNLPKVLPSVPQKIRREARVRDRFFLNYCTFGYTLPWWQWDEWEHFIDWMALNGVTMPLAITGQESIWYEVWKSYGLSDEQILHYFTGPPFLPWHRMTNIDKWGGPLPKSWLNNQMELQKKIVQRERELNMKPVLPAFSGHVPEALKTVIPQVNIHKMNDWNGFPDTCRSFFLDPLDPLFKDIQHRFLKAQTQRFGTDHIYAADAFNEVDPPSWTPEYLATVAKTLYSSMTDIDQDAVWLQMGWMFFVASNWTSERIEAFLRAVPQDRTLILDYFCEKVEIWKKTKSFFGQPFVWCYLGNFGGNTMMTGNLNEVAQRMNNAFANAGKNLAGVGGTLEGFDVNPLMYAFLFERVWEDISPETWIKRWANLRYGGTNEPCQKAWSLLLENVYIDPSTFGQGTLTNSRPSLTGHGFLTRPKIRYDNRVLLKVWETLLEKPSAKATYRYDVVNVGRQFLGNLFSDLRDTLAQNYKRKNLKQLEITGSKMLKLFDDMDNLLATQPDFLLGTWIKNARRLGVDEQERLYYERNARNIITTWGGKAQSINDYANRSWAGLTKSFYKKRWEIFITELIEAVKANKEFDEKAFKEHVTDFEWKWVDGKEIFSDSPKGNSLQIAQSLFHTYKTYYP